MESTLNNEKEVFDLAREHFGIATEETPEIIARIQAQRKEAAGRRGLTAKWSRVFGFITLHDPTTGEVHNVPTKGAPAWAKWEASTRKTLYRFGRRDAYDLTRARMEEIWHKEHPLAQDDEGIVEEHPLED
jgi:hypothetical protein